MQLLLLLDDLIDKDFQTYTELRQLNKEFDDTYNVLLFLSPKNSEEFLTDSEICDFWVWMQKLSDKRQDITSMFSSMDARKILEVDGKLKSDYFLNPSCAEGTPKNIQIGLEGIAESPWAALLSGKRKNDVVLSLYLKQTLENSRIGKFDTGIVKEIQNDFESGFLSSHPNLKGTWAGMATYMMYLKTGLDFTLLLNLGSGVFIFLLFWFIFRSPKAGSIFLFCFTFALVPTIGMMALSGAPVDSLSNTLPTLLLIASIEDFVYLSYLQKRFHHWRGCIRKTLLPGFLTSLTTFIGFDSLVSADLEIIQRFGHWAAIASAIEFFAFLILLPCLMKEFKIFRKWTTEAPVRGMSYFSKWQSFSMPRPLSVILVAGAFLSPLFVQHLNITDAPERIFPKSHPLQKAAVEIEESRGWKADVSVFFNNYENRNQNEELLKKIVQDPLIVAHENPYEVLDFLQTGVEDSTKSIFKTFWEKNPQSMRYISERADYARAILYVKSTDIVDINQLKKSIDAICGPHCFLAGTLVSYGELGGRVLSSFINSMGLGLALVILLMLVVGYYSNEKHVISLTFSSLWGPFAMLGVLLFIQTPIYFVTSIVISILVGQAGDNAIHFMCHGRADKGVEELGVGSTIANLVMCVLSAFLFLSYFQGIRNLAGLMIIGFLLCLFGDVWVFKGLSKPSKTHENPRQ